MPNFYQNMIEFDCTQSLNVEMTNSMSKPVFDKVDECITRFMLSPSQLLSYFELHYFTTLF